MMKKIGFLLVLILMATLVSVAYAEDYVAMVMDVDGDGVQFVVGGEPVEIMAFLEENDVVQIKEGGRIVIIFFESSIREEVLGPSTITIGVNGSIGSAGRSTKIRRQTVDYLPPKAQLDRKHHQNFGNIAFRRLGEAKDAGTRLVTTSISNTAYAPNTRPMLTWKVYPGADLFTLTVTGEHGTDRFTTKSSSIMMSTGVQPPGRYTWVLEARRQGKVVASRDGWYRVMKDKEYQSMSEVRDMIQNEYPSGSVQEMAVLSMLYQSYEMWNEMSLILLALKDKQPDNTEVVRKIREINPFLLEGLKP